MKMRGKKISKETKTFDESIDSLLAELELPSDSEIKKHTGNVRQAEKVRGRTRKDQSARMSGHNNIMAGKVSPNRSKAMPQISEKIKGKAKPEGHGANVSRAKKGVPIPSRQGVARPEHSETMKDPSRNKGAQTMRETMTCPHCGKTANVPNYKRWHGDNCKIKK